MTEDRPDKRRAEAAQSREQRLKSALRANLARRKEQARERGADRPEAGAENKNED